VKGPAKCGRAVAEAEALGAIKGALWALGCNPAPLVWERVAELLRRVPDPMPFAREAIGRAVAAREHGRVFAILEAA
jgi:hypothetical protein